MAHPKQTTRRTRKTSKVAPPTKRTFLAALMIETPGDNGQCDVEDTIRAWAVDFPPQPHGWHVAKVTATEVQSLRVYPTT